MKPFGYNTHSDERGSVRVNERKKSKRGNNADDSEWVVYDQNTWDYIGSHTAECEEPEPVATCEDDTACNFGAEGDCTFADEGFDCDGNALCAGSGVDQDALVAQIVAGASQGVVLVDGCADGLVALNNLVFSGVDIMVSCGPNSISCTGGPPILFE